MVSYFIFSKYEKINKFKHYLLYSKYNWYIYSIQMKSIIFKRYLCFTVNIYDFDLVFINCIGYSDIRYIYPYTLKVEISSIMIFIMLINLVIGKQYLDHVIIIKNINKQINRSCLNDIMG